MRGNICWRAVLVLSVAAASLALSTSANAALIGHWKFDEGAGTTAADSSGSGYDADRLEEALARACHTYVHEPHNWQRLVETGMKQDWSWTRSAEQYLDLYSQIVARKRA